VHRGNQFSFNGFTTEKFSERHSCSQGTEGVKSLGHQSMPWSVDCQSMIPFKLVSSALSDQLQACVHISFNPESKGKHSLQPSQSYYFSDFKFHVACAPSTCWRKRSSRCLLVFATVLCTKKSCYVLQFHVNFALRCIPHRQSWLLGDTVRH